MPERITPKVGARIMSLQDPTSKMSKSDPNERSRVLLTDSPDEILKKVKSAVTDSDKFVTYDWEEKPGISNLLELMSVSTGTPIPELVERYHDAGYGTFKIAVGEALAEALSPIRRRMKELEDEEISRIMQKGALDARQRAEQEMIPVRKAVGLSG